MYLSVILNDYFRLQAAADSRRDSLPEESSEDEDLELTDDQRASRVDFEKRRKLHYNEFEAIKMARKLIEDDDDEDEDGDVEISEVKADEKNDTEASNSGVEVVKSNDTIDSGTVP